MDSIQRFLSPPDQAALWQQPDAHQFHTNYESTDGSHSGYSFGTLDNLDTAVQSRYASWSSLPQYVTEAQVQNYEDTRAQFEAFIDHWSNGPTPATGTVYWQMNKGWPTLLWDLYNYDYDQAGAYFGAKKANEDLHVLYAYDTGGVTIDNLTGATQRDQITISVAVSGDARRARTRCWWLLAAVRCRPPSSTRTTTTASSATAASTWHPPTSRPIRCEREHGRTLGRLLARVFRAGFKGAFRGARGGIRRRSS